MTIFLIAYDLDNPGQKYPALYALLESWGAQRILESTWVVKSNSTVQEIFGALTDGPIDASDKLIGTELVGIWKTRNSMFEINDL